MKWALPGFVVFALLFRPLVWVLTRRAMNSVSREWLTSAKYWRGGDEL